MSSGTGIALVRSMKTTISKIWGVLILMTMLGLTACGSTSMDLAGVGNLQGLPTDSGFTEQDSAIDELDGIDAVDSPAENTPSFQQHDEPVEPDAF